MTVNEKLAELLNGTEVTESIETHSPMQVPSASVEESPAQPSSFMYGPQGGVYSNTSFGVVGSGMFNGEKSYGSLGAPIDLRVDARALRYRAYEANTSNDVITIITGKFFKWVIGNGLKMQSEPYEKILKLEKVTEDFEAFKSNVEQYFELYGNSPRSDFSGMDNLHLNAAKAFETAFLGGDCLVVARLDENYNPTTQVIDGCHIFSPVLEAEDYQRMTSSGHVLLHGVEVDKKGRHVAYYVRKQQIDAFTQLPNLDYERIEAFSKDTGCLMAWMIYGKKDRIDHVRGITMLSNILEKVTKLDRYTEATVATAEERAKLVWTVVHGKTSTGENPLITGPRGKISGEAAPLGPFGMGALVANQIALTEERKVYNLPVDSELKAVSSQSEINYEPFFKSIFLQLCAAVDIPPEVALQQYNSNYSASRAAINGWGFIVNIYRKRLSEKFYQPFYNLWLYVHVLKNKVKADGYLEARNSNNQDVVEAYSAAKFSGVNMPHIDPYKEIKAIREALGEKYSTMPLVSLEQATDSYGGGDWETNAKKISQEMMLANELGLVDDEEEETDNTKENATSTEAKK